MNKKIIFSVLAIVITLCLVLIGCGANKEDENTINELKHQRWQLIHDYATAVSDFLLMNFLLMNMLELEKNDLTALNLVPYTVWKKVPEKTIIIIDAIHNMK